jgi:hypothetical protein
VDECRPCGTDCGSTECQTERDAKYLLDELRKAHEALARVGKLAGSLTSASAPSADSSEYDRGYDDAARDMGNSLRAAVAAAKGDEEDEPSHEGWDRLHFQATGCDGSLHTIGDCLVTGDDE